ncbi:MAG: hypothetical protein CSA97_01020 [Bacteroidetes bacterium]|nr:MAG: hypothetical protein CSA97_01020 [Bacteroidota bacterium]
MRLTSKEIARMQEDMAADLIALLVERLGYSISGAMDALYTSQVLDKVMDVETGLYYQSAGYVFSYLEAELLTGDFRNAPLESSKWGKS